MEGNKRGREESAPHSRVPGERDSEDQTGTAGLVFEDPFEDEFEEEDIEQDYDEDEGQGEEEDEEGMGEDEMMARVEVDPTDQVRVFRQGIDPVPAGEELEYDPSAYVMYHSLRAEWPCLSFDVMRDSGGDNRVRFPLSMYIVCGSQADTRDKNKVTILKLSEMHKTYANAGTSRVHSLSGVIVCIVGTD
jgi:ribosome assembly protein RRB1